MKLPVDKPGKVSSGAENDAALSGGVPPRGDPSSPVGDAAARLDRLGMDVEAILIDDASTDGSAEVVRELVAADPRVRAILHRRNFGHVATYNEGLEQANSGYVVLLYVDDALTPGSLACAAALLETHPSVGLVYGNNEVLLTSWG